MPLRAKRLAGQRMSVPITVRNVLRIEQGRYLLVAGTTAATYLGLVAVWLWFGLPYMLAIVLAQAIVIVSAFPAYRVFVFGSTGSVAGDFWRFLTVWSSGMFAGFVATPVLVEVGGMPPLLAQTVAVLAVAIWSYLGHRFFSFRYRGHEAGNAIATSPGRAMPADRRDPA